MKLTLTDREKQELFRYGAVEINRGVCNIYIERGGNLKGYKITFINNYTDINITSDEIKKYVKTNIKEVYKNVTTK